MANSVHRVALYARVSTANGHQDPEMQLRELREYAARRDLTIIGEYIDRMTGSKDSRPSLNSLMPTLVSGSSMLSSFGSWTGLADRFATWSTLWRNSRPWD
jgi:hypothetical protein